MFDGQSLGITPFTTAQAYPAKFMATHPDSQHVVANIPSTTYAQRETSARGRVDHLFSRSLHCVLVDDGGSYDISTAHGNMNAAQALAAKAAYTEARRAAGADYIVGLTISPAVILTDTEETARQAVNAALLADPEAYGYDEIVDVASIPELQDTGNLTYYFDGTHWTDTATTLVAQSLIDAGI